MNINVYCIPFCISSTVNADDIVGAEVGPYEGAKLGVVVGATELTMIGHTIPFVSSQTTIHFPKQYNFKLKHAF